MTVENYIKNFEDTFYNPTYTRWRVTKDKSAEDIVGENYETFRKNHYEKLGFRLSNKNKIALVLATTAASAAINTLGEKTNQGTINISHKAKSCHVSAPIW